VEHRPDAHTTTTATLRTFDQIRAAVRNDACGMRAEQAQSRKDTASAVACAHLVLGDVAAHIEATVAADEWDAIATDPGRRTAA